MKLTFYERFYANKAAFQFSQLADQLYAFAHIDWICRGSKEADKPVYRNPGHEPFAPIIRKRVESGIEQGRCISERMKAEGHLA